MLMLSKDTLVLTVTTDTIMALVFLGYKTLV